jgi:hypothetical protein
MKTSATPVSRITVNRACLAQFEQLDPIDKRLGEADHSRVDDLSLVQPNCKNINLEVQDRVAKP